MSQSNEDIISKAIGIPKIDDLGKYLGTPNISKRVTKATFQYIIDWVDKRLTDWRTKALFFSVGNLGCGMGECGKGGEGVGESW